MTTTRLEGKVALITGSDSGIGQATAIAFAREGADVVVTYLHDADGATATAEAVEATGHNAIVVQATSARRSKSRGCSIRPSASLAPSTSS
jgi:glucose 1-dehydrogenase